VEYPPFKDHNLAIVYVDFYSKMKGNNCWQRLTMFKKEIKKRKQQEKNTGCKMVLFSIYSLVCVHVCSYDNPTGDVRLSNYYQQQTSGFF